MKKPPQHNKSNDRNDMVNNLFSGDLKKEVAENVKKITNLKSIPIFITGPFRNGKTCKSYWVVVYGNCGTAWMLKSEFIRGYLKKLLSRHQQSKFDINHCTTYEDFNIRKEEFGLEDEWKRTPTTNKLVSRVYFVYSCDTTNKIIRKQDIIESIKFFFMSMEIHDMNPVGPMLLAFLRNHVEPLYNYIMKGKSSEDSAGVYLNKEIDKYCRRGYNLFWGDSLNRCMVDYDISYILKNYVGYTLWSNVPHKQKQLCYRTFDNKFNLPDWDIEKEKF
jgi:hypothetical protein